MVLASVCRTMITVWFLCNKIHFVNNGDAQVLLSSCFDLTSGRSILASQNATSNSTTLCEDFVWNRPSQVSLTYLHPEPLNHLEQLCYSVYHCNYYNNASPKSQDCIAAVTMLTYSAFYAMQTICMTYDNWNNNTLTTFVHVYYMKDTSIV